MGGPSDKDRHRRRERKKQRRAARKNKKEPRKEREDQPVVPPPPMPPGGGDDEGIPPEELPLSEQPEPFRPVTTVGQARQAARTLGIDHVHIADPTDRRPSQRRAYLEVLNRVLEPLHALHRAGRLMPPSLRVDPALFEEESAGQHAVFEPYGEDGPEIRINPDLVLWSAEQAAKDHDLGTFSTADPRGGTYHEYLHFRVFHSNPLIYIALQAGELVQAEVEKLSPLVSEYAGQNALEFASEVYAALRTGHPGYAAEVMLLYHQIVGFAGLGEDDL
jgi:hypothetical protein